MPSSARLYKTEAIILRQRKLGEADRILTLLTPTLGKLDAKAKGVRKTMSRLSGHLQPLNRVVVQLAQGHAADVITGVETLDSFRGLRDDLDRLSRAFYVAELTDRATEEREANFAVYRLLLDALRRLCQDCDLDLVLRFFEMSLLVKLGYQPELGVCVVCRGAPADDGNSWSAALGGVVCPSCRPPAVALFALSPGALRVLRLLQGGSFAEVARISLDPRLAGELERHLRETIHYALDRDVRSAAFLDDVRRNPRSASPQGVSGVEVVES